MEALLHKTVRYFNPSKKNAGGDFSHTLSFLLREAGGATKDIVVICIGSDRATGDCLGPLVGDKLNKSESPFYVYGTLENPVHAKNLSKTIETIKKCHYDPLVIAIDASLGTSKHVGYVTMGKGSLRPGLGVDKNLPVVGDIFITGIVNSSGLINHMLLQTTRLNLVMQLADFIYKGIRDVAS